MQKRSFILLFSLGVLAVAAACSDSAAPAGGGGGRGRGRGGEGGAVPVVTTKVVAARRPGRHRRHRQRRSVHHDFGPVAGDRDHRVDDVSRRRLRQERSAALHDRQAAVRGRRSGRPKPTWCATRRCSARPRPSWCATASQSEYATLTAQRQAQLAENGIVSKDVAEQARAAPTPVAAHHQGGPRRGRKREGAARRAAGDGGQRDACSSATRRITLADRRTQRQHRGQGRRSRDGQPDRADDDRAGRADLRHVLDARRRACRPSRRTRAAEDSGHRHVAGRRRRTSSKAS